MLTNHREDDYASVVDAAFIRSTKMAALIIRGGARNDTKGISLGNRGCKGRAFTRWI